MVLTGLTNSDGELGSPEPRVIQFYSASEEGGFIRVLRISRHQAEVGAALAERLVDHLSLVVNDNILSGHDVQTASRRAESLDVVRRPL
jgi:hypothetical protein